MTSIFEIAQAFISIDVVIALFAGVTMGIVGGGLPGISPSMTIALLLPISLYLPTTSAIALLMGSYQGAMFGGSISAILINTPGTASAAATVLDGYAMSLKGQSGKALNMALYASCLGGIVGIVILLFMAPYLAKAALKFGPPEYFGLMMLSIALIAGISGKTLTKGIAAASLGVLFSTVGLDPIYGTRRFTFDTINLSDGISTLSVFIGLFAMSELMIQLMAGRHALSKKPETMAISDKLTLRELWSQKMNILISGIMGALIGSLPGVGGSTACFVAYADAQRRSKTPEKFGMGIIDGVAAAEAANNAVAGGALVPMLTLGIPGDVVTAILVGALIAHGIKPGPLLFVENIGAVYQIYIALFLAIIVLFIVGKAGIPVFSKIVKVKKSLLLPLILIICVIGTYSYRANVFDCIVMLLFGALGFAMRRLEFPIAPMVIAFVIGKAMELSLRQSLLMSKGSLMIFFTRPLSAFLLVFAVLFAGFVIYRNRKNELRSKAN